MTGRDNDFDSAWIAIKTGNVEEFTKVMTRTPSILQGRQRATIDMRDWTLLHYAAFLDQPEIVKFLLARGAASYKGEVLQMLDKHQNKSKENSRSYAILASS